MIKKFGLIGKNLGHSFSKIYFETKFKELGLSNYEYNLYPIKKIDELQSLLNAELGLQGLNVTIPYKEEVIKFLDELDPVAKEIHAVNCVRLVKQNDSLILKGYNTDVYGFRQSIKPFLEPQHEKALLLGTGGASKAVQFVLNSMGIPFFSVTRNKIETNQFSYEELNPEIIKHFKLIINCTPLGMFPASDQCPNIPYEAIESDFLIYDLVYNPEQTLYLKKAKEQGAVCINGLSMLYHQADEAWRIWNDI